MTVKIAATEAELKNILQLRYAVLRAPWGKPIETATDDLEQQSVNAYMDDESGQVVACGRLHKNSDTVGQIRFMAVAAGQQGRGLGRLLALALEEKARVMGLQKIELQARENAVEFYKACGYVVKEKTFLLWDLIQHYRMEKEV